MKLVAKVVRSSDRLSDQGRQADWHRCNGQVPSGYRSCAGGSSPDSTLKEGICGN